jgi:hypothetical protein
MMPMMMRTMMMISKEDDDRDCEDVEGQTQEKWRKFFFISCDSFKRMQNSNISIKKKDANQAERSSDGGHVTTNESHGNKMYFSKINNFNNKKSG